MGVGAEDAPNHRDRHSGRPGDKYAISFRRQFLAVTACLLAVNLMIGLFARHQQRTIIDYAMNIYDTARAEGLEIRADIAELLKPGIDSLPLDSRINDIQQKMERLHQNNSAVGLQARDDIEAFSHNSDLLLLGSTLTSFMLAGLVLLVTLRMISSLNQRSSDHLYAALEACHRGSRCSTTSTA